jgi:hypothetical protein
LRLVHSQLSVVDPVVGPDVGPDVEAAGGTRGPAAVWAEGLADMVRIEIDDARRGGLITAGEAEQLLARIVLVIDQAVVPRGAR